jgi:hypothetical protein
MPPALAATICPQRFAGQIVGRDDKNTIWFGIGDIHHAKKPARGSLAESNPRAVCGGAVFSGITQYLANFRLGYAMLIYVRLARIGIAVEPNPHGCLMRNAIVLGQSAPELYSSIPRLSVKAQLRSAGESPILGLENGPRDRVR